MPDDPFAPLEEDARLARAGRSFRAERRAEAEAYEALLAKGLARSRTIADVARDLCRRGDAVEVCTPTARFRGRIRAVGDDLLSLDAPVGVVDIALGNAATLQVVQRASAGGRDPAHSAATFRTRLAEHEAAGTEVRLGTTLPVGDLDGRLEVVARDHVVVSGQDGTRYVGLPAVTFALTAR